MGSNSKKKLKSNKKRKMKKMKQQNQSQNTDGEKKLVEPEAELQNDERPDTDWKPQKRLHMDDDSESENEPIRKKKKKKQIIPDNTTDKKNKKSIRQMKKEKFAQRQAEMEAASKEQLKSQCINYLSQWKHNRSNWKFMKAKQVWLFKNKFSQKLVPNESWPLLMEYFESAKGNIRNMLLDDANKIIKQMDDWTESQNEEKSEEQSADTDENEETNKSKKPDDTVYKRARDLIQCLQE